MRSAGIKWFFTEQLGFSPRRTLAGLVAFPRYMADLRRFHSSYGGRIEFFPCLHDSKAEAGAVHGEYFLQDLYVAQQIFKASPAKHVDIGSRLDGFVAHVASFREIEVFDVRPLKHDVTHIKFVQADASQPLPVRDDYCDSLSCLHALEHFGLGRYGDPIDSIGWKKGLTNMVRILATNGTFYLSVPIGEERVEFNGHRVFNPATILVAAKALGLGLDRFWYVKNGKLVESLDTDKDIARLGCERYALGGFTWKK